MKISVLFISMFVISALVSGQSNTEIDSLTKVLETVYQMDQAPRFQLDSIEYKYGYDSPEAKEQWNVIKTNDSANILIVTEILNKYGWLSESKTSKTANSALFLVVQHAELNLQIKYLDILKKAVEKGAAKPSNYAYLLDRVNMRQGKLQIYGSQISRSTNGRSYFYPIKDEPNVNKRREKLHLPSLEAVAFKSGFIYTLPLEDSIKNNIVITGFVMDPNQKPVNEVNIVLGSKIIGKSNADGYYRLIITKELLKSPLSYVKEGYIISDPPLQDDGKEVIEFNIILHKH